MNPISKVLKLTAEAKVADAKKVVSAQVLESSSSYPAREALLSALECGSYEAKFGKRRGKKLTLLDEQLPLEQTHAMIINEANAELRKTFLELVQDDLSEKEYYTLVNDTPVIVSLDEIGALPEAYQIDVLAHFKASESALKKHARELNTKQGYLTVAELSAEQKAKLAATRQSADEGEEDDSEDESDETE